MHAVRRFSLVAALIAVFASAPAAAQCPTQLLTDPVGATGDWLGNAVVAHGDFAFVTSRRDQTPGYGEGTVLVFQRQSSGWVRVGELAPAAGQTRGIYGVDLSADGDRLLVGSYRHLGESGPAFLYERVGTSWQLEQLLEAPQWTPNDVYAFAVGIDGDTALVARPKDPTVLFEAGSVYVFEKGASGWTRTAQLRASDPQIEARFGNEVDIDGDICAVGAWWWGAADEGAVYVFERGGGVWTEVARLHGDTVGSFTHFGEGISLQGERLIVGAPEIGGGTGSAYVFERGSAGWTRVAKLQPDGGDQDRFGFEVFLDGERAFVSAPLDDGAANNTGAVYVFEHDGDTWQRIAKLNAPLRAGSGLFGTLGVAATGDDVLFGMPFFDAGAHDAGAVYVWSLPRGVAGVCFGTTCPCGSPDPTAGCANSTGAGAQLTACGATGSAADALRLTAHGLPAAQPLTLLAGRAPRDLPFGAGRLCVAAGSEVFTRLPLQLADAGGGWHLSGGLYAALAAAGASLDPGETWYLQVWYRDPAATCGGAVNLTNALRLLVGP